jgi:phage tail-like protein
MARAQTTDYLQTGRFHVVDVSFTVPPILLPVYGFRTCTLPEIIGNVRSINEGNYEFPRKVYAGAEIGDVTLTQGVSLLNSDFYDWMRKAIVGHRGPRNILIIQFLNTKGTRFTGSGLITGGLEFVGRLPGRAWLLKNCRPSRYKPGSDFDAMSQEVSLAELTLSIEELQEYSLGI